MKFILRSNIKHLALWLLISLVVGCGGGGGGGNDGRTRETALRIIHGSIDSSPVTTQLSPEVILNARFAGGTSYSNIPPGPQRLSLFIQNSPNDQIGTVSFEALNETEYTIFVVGENREGRRRLVLIEEPVVRPDAGQARIQVLNGVIGSGSIVIEGSDFSTTALEGQSSGYVDTNSGPQTLRVLDQFGNLLETRSVDIVETGEITLLVAGSVPLAVEFTQVFEDLD